MYVNPVTPTEVIARKQNKIPYQLVATMNDFINAKYHVGMDIGRFYL